MRFKWSARQEDGDGITGKQQGRRGTDERMRGEERILGRDKESRGGRETRRARGRDQTIKDTKDKGNERKRKE